ncbi:DMT family transporter [Sporolactobacillus sp. CPB3-1]|uniref:DMT family transporter n=1 Tax=Sporolactobacillus mangiferae TaxID=2940498 RepID=A0ABT0M8Y7_9BACL|nr:DMT family transporter [Sporolactobacillus mangiferae]MCL1631332.1 DMT family transporter [Sporolactobacillus mangiferae]
MKASVLGASCLALAAAIWGGMYVVSKYVLQFIAPLALVWLRYLLGSMLLFALLCLQQRKAQQRLKLSKKQWLMLLWIGFIGYFVSIASQFIGTKLSDAHTGAMITAATPVFVVVCARFVLRERFTVRKVLSLLIATSGVALTIGLPDHFGNYFWGCIMLVLAAVTWALLSVSVKQAAEFISPLAMTAYTIFFALIFTSPFMIYDWAAGAIHIPDWRVIAGILYLGAIATAGAFFLWNKGLAMIDAGSGSLFLFLQPIVGTLLGWLILGEELSIHFAIGSLLILAGVAVVTFEPQTKDTRQNRIEYIQNSIMRKK